MALNLSRRSFLRTTAGAAAVGSVTLTAARLVQAREENERTGEELQLSQLLDEHARNLRAMWTTGIGVTVEEVEPREDMEVDLRCDDHQLRMQIGKLVLPMDAVTHIATAEEHFEWLNGTIERKARTSALRQARQAGTGAPAEITPDTPLVMAHFSLLQAFPGGVAPEELEHARLHVSLLFAGSGGPCQLSNEWVDKSGTVVHSAITHVYASEVIAASLTQRQLREMIITGMAFGANSLVGEGSVADQPGVQRVLGRIAGRPVAVRT